MVSENAQNANSAHAMELQDLPNGRKSRYKKYFLWGLGLIILIILITIITVSITGENKTSEKLTNSSKITIDDILQLNTFYAQDFNGSWISDTEILYRDANENVVLYDVETKNKTILVERKGNLFLMGVTNIELSPDRKYLLLERITRKIYRYSYLSTYVIYNLETKEFQQLSHKNDKEFQLAIWSPTNNSLVYIKDNNIYYIPSVEDSEYKYYPITTDGVIGVIYNGAPDWVYEEEVFNTNKALWFSPDGKQLAFIKFNDSLTRIMPIPFYGLPGDLVFQYPLEQHIRYPKPGTPNPTVEIIVVNLEELNENKLTLKHMNIPKALVNRQPLLSVVSWATNESLIAIWMNRAQYFANIVLYDVNKPDFETTIISVENKKGWLELFTAPKISKNGSQFLLITSQDQGNGTGEFSHIVMYETKENATAVPLTKGKFVVTDILSWDENNNYVYYLSNTENDPAVRHLNRVSTQKPFQSECISCNLTTASEILPMDSDTCLYNNAEFSKGNSYFVWSCSGPSVPFSSVYKTSNLSEVFLWEANKNVQEAVSEKDMPQIERFKVAVDDKFEAQVKLLLPADVDKSGRTKYPMLVKVYAGPGSFQVVEKFSVEWESYLVSSKNIIVAFIDGRGSGLKGDNMMFAGFRKLGTVEIYDQINVTRYIQEQFNYIDPKRTAIWGWSYGGYAAGMSLALDKQNVFKCGISVGPVTDWALYDSIYTERFMGLPTREDNLYGYINAQLLNKVEGLRNKTYFLVHGTMDDNVHYQQSMMLSRRLERNDIMFRQLSYPDENHGLFGVRKHLYHNLEDFLDHCFKSEDKKNC